MQTFTREDLVKDPEGGNVEGREQSFIIFNTTSSEMVKLEEGDKFGYGGEIYEIDTRLPENYGRPNNIQFNCLRIGKL